MKEDTTCKDDNIGLAIISTFITFEEAKPAVSSCYCKHTLDLYVCNLYQSSQQAIGKRANEDFSKMSDFFFVFII